MPEGPALVRALDETLNRKLDGLCIKYAAAGIGGLRGSSDLLARDRRVRLTDHVVHAGIISAADLPLLDAARRRP